MTYYLAENPWYLAGVLGVVGAGFLIALKVTQDGRHLTRALIALSLAAAVIAIEQVWVTDAERIEWAVKGIASALSRSDPDGVLTYLDDRVIFGLPRETSTQEIEPAALRDRLKEITFDWVHLSRLTTNAGSQTRRGSAEFRLSTSGTYHMQIGSQNFAGNSDWSLGFRKLPTGEWKVTRITAVALPPFAALPVMRFGPRREPGFSNEVGQPEPGRRGLRGRGR